MGTSKAEAKVKFTVSPLVVPPESEHTPASGGAIVTAMKRGGGVEIIESISTVTANATASGKPRLYEDHPLVSLAGKYAGDPFWRDIRRAIDEYRALPDTD